MCGIIGYIGKKIAVPILVNGLYNLEYRGYDSAGVAVVRDLKIHVERSLGNVESLARSAVRKLPESDLGIAHTRWASQGAQSIDNTHPLCDCTGSIALVHNGFIENYRQLREMLTGLGHAFKSETDSEVICHLIEEKLKTNAGIESSVLEALTELEGTYGLAVVHAGNPDLLIAARNGSPLLIGVRGGQYIVASDRSALIPFMSEAMDLYDGEVAFIKRDGVGIISAGSTGKDTKAQERSFNGEAVVRNGGYAYAMQKELAELPEALGNVLRGRLADDWEDVNLGGLLDLMPKIRAARKIIFIGSGTAWHSAIYGKYVIEKLTGIRAEAMSATRPARRKNWVKERDVVVAISQGGDTADTLEALQTAKAAGALTLGLTNKVGSPLARESHGGIYIHSGPDHGLISTKAFACQAAALVLFGLSVAGSRKEHAEECLETSRELRRIPERVSEILSLRPLTKEAADCFDGSAVVSCFGEGFNHPAALEGAMGLREVLHVHAEGYPAAMKKRRLAALLSSADSVILITPDESGCQTALRIIGEARKRCASIISITDCDDARVKDASVYTMQIPKTIPILTPILSSVSLQMLVMCAGMLRVIPRKKPGNLVGRTADQPELPVMR